jgi:hypothetical protein
MIKKIFFAVTAPVVALSMFLGLSFAQISNNQNPYTNPTDGGDSTDVAVVGSGTGQQDSFVNVVKGAINWILGILALIALIILLYGGFQMVTSAGDEEKYTAGFTILKHAATGLILIGVAWFIVSIIFWLTNVLTQGVAPAGTNA